MACIDCGKQTSRPDYKRCRKCSDKFLVGENSINYGRKRPDITGENHWAWVGKEVSYRDIHKWVQYHLGKATRCIFSMRHKSTRYHWANVSHAYKRELDDWIQLCPSCNSYF